MARRVGYRVAARKATHHSRHLQEETVPKSQVRKKKIYTAPSDVLPAANAVDKKPSPTWLPVTAVALVAFGIGWLVVFYLSQSTLPVASWGYWNLAVGFGAMVASLALFSKWR
jgi:hypothetical protein